MTDEDHFPARLASCRAKPGHGLDPSTVRIEQRASIPSAHCPSTALFLIRLPGARRRSRSSLCAPASAIDEPVSSFPRFPPLTSHHVPLAPRLSFRAVSLFPSSNVLGDWRNFDESALWLKVRQLENSDAGANLDANYLRATMATEREATELKQQGAIEAARDPESSVTADDAKRMVVEQSKNAGVAAFTFNPDASPEEKAAQVREVSLSTAVCT